eukprot:CAMPEP_0119102006 /NCGR_PEP_ID=MMETSP1180-20130426/893_1 /TAXON_ID=3052 ORGANISM="Chlamydomonas cf sp, Strain CCMP681" /NCGR_SAMPLE_ID=MMETSP1180 /ASSEMBLY_ACC=CAM_ASM_000741 /LENGTH=406 /DNA_ID=CAMNT_0007086213 /DNA_START=27 /DNA_END=1244 /DNA_ORIENTATION=+
MGKDFNTPKAIANRIKAKGLQKLRWYCQLCAKQCRDENGFKCHQMSDGHRRQMDVFGMNPNKVVGEYSEQFEEEFLTHFKRAHPFSRVLAKNVYNEYIADRHHVHMNSTCWLTLTDFVKHLGREGKCKVDETEKGWYMTLIMKDPMQEIDEEKKLKRSVAEKEEEERHQTEINIQVDRARKMARIEGAVGAGLGEALVKTDDTPIVLSLAPSGLQQEQGPGTAAPSGSNRPGLPPRPTSRPTAASAAFGEDDDEGVADPSGPGGPRGGKLGAMMRQELEAKAKRVASEAALHTGAGIQRSAAWLAPGIVVKVMSKDLQEHGYYKKKGVVERVLDRYVGEVCMLDSGDVLRVDQAQLETVIPQPGGAVLLLNGPHKGCRGTLEEIDTAKFKALVRVSDGPSKGSEVW